MSSAQKTLLIATALALWASAGIAVFAQNRLLLAFWFVLTHLTLPLVFFLLGWLCHTIISGSTPVSFPKLICLHLSVLLFATLALPIVLAFINLLPIAQTTSSWRGRITVHEQVETTGIRGSRITVASETLGPYLRFNISNEEYTTLAEAAQVSALSPVEGVVVRGFMGVPIAVRLQPTLPQPSR